uniref:Uncharacterized protein n=1 Tax=Timema cristinae TaxID=61476 RepID=A0A7R9D5G5_TIMCR|nr:unnamed protein product [Timema cristinae]
MLLRKMLEPADLPRSSFDPLSTDWDGTLEFFIYLLVSSPRRLAFLPRHQREHKAQSSPDGSVVKRGITEELTANYYVWEVRRAKEACWSGFVSSTGNQDPWGLVYKLTMGKSRQAQVVAGLRVDGLATDDAARVVLRFTVLDDEPCHRH